MTQEGTRLGCPCVLRPRHPEHPEKMAATFSGCLAAYPRLTSAQRDTERMTNIAAMLVKVVVKDRHKSLRIAVEEGPTAPTAAQWGRKVDFRGPSEC